MWIIYYLGIEAFLAIARTQNVSRAAEQLNLAQTTVSKRLKLLEQELGVTLVERGKGIKTIQLTSMGEEFISIAERWIHLLLETQALPVKGPMLSLSIGTLDSINFGLFPALYRALNKNTPKIKLRVITSHSPELYDAVENREVNVAFSLLEQVHPNVVVEKCYTEPMVGITLASSSYNTSDPIRPRDLNPNAELYVLWGPTYRLWHDQWWDPICPGRVQVDTSQLILSFMHDPDQWSIVPLSVAKAAQAKNDISIFRLSPAPPERICYKLTHKHPKATTLQALEVFNAHLQNVLAETFPTQ